MNALRFVSPGGSSKRPLRAGYALLTLAALVLAGCASGPQPGARFKSGGGIDSLHVFGVPVAMDLDGEPGPDSFGLTLYASAGGAAKGVAITAGHLEIVMFDGAFSPERLAPADATPPRHRWTFTPADLKRSNLKTSLGLGYRLTPAWGDTPPHRDSITVVVRYLPLHGNAVVSAPVTIAVTAK